MPRQARPLTSSIAWDWVSPLDSEIQNRALTWAIPTSETASSRDCWGGPAKTAAALMPRMCG